MTPRSIMAELFGKVDGLLAGQGRLDAPLRPREGLPRRPRHRRRPHPARRRRRASRIKYRGDGPGLALLLRRGGGEQRRVPRGAQHGRRSGSCPRLHHREQPLRDGHRASSGRRRSTTCTSARRRYGMPRRSRSTARTSWRCARPIGDARRARPRRRGPDAARDPHLPLHGPLDVRRGQRHLPHQGRARGVAEARPDRAARGADARRRHCSTTPDSPRSRPSVAGRSRRRRRRSPKNRRSRDGGGRRTPTSCAPTRGGG